MKIYKGISVDHKRIQRFEAIEAGWVRIIIGIASEKPIIKSFSAYNYWVGKI